MRATTSGTAPAAPDTAARCHRAGPARPVVGVVRTRSGTSPGIRAGRSWDHPGLVLSRADLSRRAHRCRALRRAQGPKVFGGAGVVRGARQLRSDRVVPLELAVLTPRQLLTTAGAAAVPPVRAAKAAAAPRLSAVLVARCRIRPARVCRTAGGGGRVPGRHRPEEGPRRKWRRTPPVATWVALQAVHERNRRRAPSRWGEGGRCATPTYGRPTVPDELGIAAGVRCRPMDETLDIEAMIQRFRDRAHAVRNRTLPPVAGEERMQFIRQAEIDYQDFAIVGDAEGTIDDGVLVLRVDLRPKDSDSA
jgi:hypothetical protein